MELLLGCGNRREKIWGGSDWGHLVTLDIDPALKPDVVWDLETLPLPFDPDTFDEIHASEVLEHTGRQGDWRFFLAQFDDFWRILKPGGTLSASVPRSDSVWALGDPGHTRIIVEQQLGFLHRPAYGQIGQTSMTDYRPYFRGDWNLVRRDYTDHHLRFQIQAVKPAR